VVWEAALFRVCTDNALFLPSFPISNMNDSELENTAMAPTRWIEFCRRVEAQDVNDHRAILDPQTRILEESICSRFQACRIFMVPGGRYLVTYSSRIPPGNISVFDFCSISKGDCKLIASVGLPVEIEYRGWTVFTVQATVDGVGLTIFLSNM
jgi:hypothetical protein